MNNIVGTNCKNENPIIIASDKLKINFEETFNLTNDFIKNIPGNGKFLYSSFQNFTNKDIVNMLEKNGVKLKVERGNRYFPVSDRAEDVRACLENEVRKYKSIQIKTNSRVSKILVENEEIQ